MRSNLDANPPPPSDRFKDRIPKARDNSQLGEIFEESRERLKRIVAASIDTRVQGRIDASDVLQETLLEASRRIEEYNAAPTVSLFVWLRFLAKQQLMMAHRRHLNVKARDARRDLPLHSFGEGSGSAVALAAQLAARLTTASAALSRKELQREIQSSLAQLDEKSREILMLRHFEQLTNIETAQVLSISSTAACNRYVRALERLKLILVKGNDGTL